MFSSKPLLQQLVSVGRRRTSLSTSSSLSFACHHSSCGRVGATTIGQSLSANNDNNNLELLVPLRVLNKVDLWHHQHRSYHVTTSTSLPVRRRRRRGDSGGVPADEENQDGEGRPTTYEEHSPLTDLMEFEQKGQECLDKFHKSVQPMIPINDPFVVERTYDLLKITLDKATGSYELEMEEDERVLVFRSPVSGAHSYFYSTKLQEWVDVNDFHSLEGMFVRDLIRHCKGVPKI